MHIDCVYVLLLSVLMTFDYEWMRIGRVVINIGIKNRLLVPSLSFALQLLRLLYP